MTSYPNQLFVTIHKDKCEHDFLQVNKCDWMEAYSTLNRGAFGLYLYLCGNMNGFHLGLSSVAVQRALGISDSTYRRAKKSLIESGYLVEGRNAHDYHFYPTPHLSASVKKEKNDELPVMDGEPPQQYPAFVHSQESAWKPDPIPYRSQYGWEDD